MKGKPFAPDARMKRILSEALAVGNAAGRTMARTARPSVGIWLLRRRLAMGQWIVRWRL